MSSGEIEQKLTEWFNKLPGESLGKIHYDKMISIVRAQAAAPGGVVDEPEAESLAQLLSRVRRGSIDAEIDIIEMFNARRKELAAALTENAGRAK